MKISIRIYNRFLDLKGELDSYQSLQFGRDYHSIATFELHVNRYLHEAQKLNKGDIIALNKLSNKVAIVLTKEIALDENGKESENFKLSGYTLDGLMSRRITVPPSGTSHDRVSGSAEEVMKHFVNKNFVNPDDNRRILPHLEIAPNQNRGTHVSSESRFKNVAEELENISIQSGLGWGIFADFHTKKLIFDVFEADDLTQENLDGNNPVFFSPEFETIQSQSFVDSDTELRNVGYVGGQGEGVGRKVIQVGKDIGWQRIETFVDVRDLGTKTEEDLTDAEVEELLEKRGEEKMRDMETLQSLEATILTPTQGTIFKYEKDYDLGDKVDVVNKSWGILMSAPIIEFLEIYEADGLRLEATFGRSRPTFLTKIKRKFNELEGVDQQELPALIGIETRKYTDRELLKEEQERIRQALENLEASKEFTKDYAEKKRVELPTEPEDKSVVWVDISDLDNIIWKIYSEEKGKWIAAARGPQGLPGPAGKDGQALYTWLKYADDEKGNGIADTPKGKKYMGLAYNKETSVESTNPGDYEWSKIEGDKGAPGPEGKDGQPRYTWVKYADDDQGRGMSDSPKGKEYIGLAYNKLIVNESDSPNDYAWSLIKGTKGEKGDKGAKGDQGIQGPRGSNGQPTYTWIRYADNANGDEMSSSPTNKEYIGIAPNKTIQTPSNNANDYEWAKLKGEPGAKGQQGIQGPKGSDGQPRYTWVRYADNANGGGISNFPDGKEYIGFAYNKTTATESKNASDYTWSKIKGNPGSKGDKGEPGSQGPVGPRGPNIVDTNTSFGVNWLIADYIKSLNGLNINEQFKVSNNGDVSIGNDRIQMIAGGKQAGINIKNGAFTLEDDISSEKYNITPKANLLLDHSFELLPDDGPYDSSNNWREIVTSPIVTGSRWQTVKDPKVTGQWYPVRQEALAMFGKKAAVVKNANYFRQYVYENIGIGVTYTVSAYFKRHLGSGTGGIPLIEVWHVKEGTGRHAKIFTDTFAPVPDDYSQVRHASTFSTPSDFKHGDALEIIFSGGTRNPNWIQVDGTQLVELDMSTVYQSEDSLWNMADGTYSIVNSMQKLWSGTIYPTESQSATPNKMLRHCRNGWALEWRGYNIGEGFKNSNYQYTYVPKSVLNSPPNNKRGYGCSLRRFSQDMYKYIYINGNDGESLSGYADNNVGNANRLALNAIYEW
ncbi:Gp37-like protein [Oceanobacillus neutriphilus]|uniref:Gp28/Gp37-like domain-containing protein n=1 Tax=Oceanobacillus neutriphilus TaxID=531815 RepID=A0ABQ2NPD7_9BACI|nr:hypothetical protein [Oceanobacillus neutriphilus]GGP07891.1 hypothetical protein GCM10011346_05950 [Oceanobacillus neutriphilus]